MDSKQTKGKGRISRKPNENGFSYFLVKTKGYKKQFTNEETARRNFAKIEKKRLEDNEAFKVELLAKKDLRSDWQELDFVEYGASFFE